MTTGDSARSAFAVGLWVAVAIFIAGFSLQLALFWGIELLPRLSETVAVTDARAVYVEFAVRLVMVPLALVAAVLLYHGVRGGRVALVVAMGLDLLMLGITAIDYVRFVVTTGVLQPPWYVLMRGGQWVALAVVLALTWPRVRVKVRGQPVNGGVAVE